MKLLEILAKNRVVAPAAVDVVHDVSAKTGWSPAAIVVKAGLIDPPRLQALVATELKERKVDVDKEKPDAATLLVVPPHVCWQRRVIPTWLKEDRATGDALYLAMTDPTDEIVLNGLAALRVRLIPYVADDAAIERALARCHPGRAPEAIPAGQLQRVIMAQQGVVQTTAPAPEAQFLSAVDDEELTQPRPAQTLRGATPSAEDLEWLLQRQQEAGLGRKAAPPGSAPAPAFVPPPVTLSTPPPATGDAGRRALALNLVLVGAPAQRARVRGVLQGWFASLQEADTFRQALGVAMTEHVDVFVLLDPAADADGRTLLPAFLQRPKRPRVIAEGDDAGLAVDARLGRSMNELEIGAKIVRALAHG